MAELVLVLGLMALEGLVIESRLEIGSWVIAGERPDGQGSLGVRGFRSSRPDFGF